MKLLLEITLAERDTPTYTTRVVEVLEAYLAYTRSNGGHTPHLMAVGDTILEVTKRAAATE